MKLGQIGRGKLPSADLKEANCLMEIGKETRKDSSIGDWDNFLRL
jgi:hypothetical protein